jgi:DNA-binding transcriptional MerR regulator
MEGDMAQTIGQAAKASGIPARTIRFYEAAGVLPPPGRSPSGYRQYTADAVRQLLFVRRARALGLSLPHLKALLAALDHGRRPERARMREAVRAHLASVRGQIRNLRALEAELVAVLARLPKRSRGEGAGPCRCFDPLPTRQARGGGDG